MFNFRILCLVSLLIFVKCEFSIDDSLRSLFLSNGRAFNSLMSNFPLDDRLVSKFLQDTGSTLSPECMTASKEYLMHVYKMVMTRDTVNTPSWVIQLMDTSGKPPAGILEGNLKWLGSFSECLDIKVHKLNSTQLRFTGQYCTADVQYHDTNTTEAILKTLGITRGGIGKEVGVTMGICWPSSCKAHEIAHQINKIFGSFKTFANIEVAISPSDCRVSKVDELDGLAIATIILLSVFGIIMFAGTVCDLMNFSTEIPPEVEPGLFQRILVSFSVYTNGKKILDTKQNQGTFTCVHGLRFLSIAWVILGHTYVNGLMQGPISNLGTLKEAVRYIAFDIVLNSTFSVDTFLVIGGFLVTYLFLKEMRKNDGEFGIRKLFLFYFHRYWRLTPAFSVNVLIVASLFTNIATGPLWEQETQMKQDNCRKYWWRDLLYIQNFFNLEETCHDLSWYLGIDMQFYVVSLLIVYPLYKLKALGLTMIGLFFVATTLTAGLIIHVNDLTAILYANVAENYQPDSLKMDFMNLVYTKPWCRMGPYLVGMLLGYIVYKTNLSGRRRLFFIVAGWTMASVTGLTLVFGNYYYYSGDWKMSNAENSIYGALSRSVWGIVISWIIFACVTGYGGFVNTFLSWKVFIPLSRLTYCAYLIHIYVLIAFYSSQKTTIHFNHYFMILIFLGVLGITMALSFVFSLAFEAPMMELEKVFWRKSNPVRRKRRGSSSDPEVTPIVAADQLEVYSKEPV